MKSNREKSADIVDLSATRGVCPHARVHRFQRLHRAVCSSQGAELLSIRQHLSLKGAVGIEDLSFIRQQYSKQIVDQLMAETRHLLNTEFGYLRVHRHRDVFVVSHHCMDRLVAGILRVKFHCMQFPVPFKRSGRRLSDQCGLPLSWGVGHSLIEAERERMSCLTGRLPEKGDLS